MSVVKILKLRAISSIHPGSGTGIGVIDMPVQRERHTGYPIIPGSSVKGVLKSIYSNGYKEDIFGPENLSDSQGDYASSASFSDARIFAYPVRSAKGVFVWITCPEIIRRINNELGKNFNIPQVQEQKIICSNDSFVINNNKVILEEYDFDKLNGVNIDNNLIEFGKSFFSNDYDKEAFSSRFAIISDDDFTHFVRYATEIVARIALEKDKKVTKQGALFYEEFLPSETLFYSVVRFEDSRKNPGVNAQTLAENFEFNSKIIQFGGDETIGKGLCEVNIE